MWPHRPGAQVCAPNTQSGGACVLQHAGSRTALPVHASADGGRGPAPRKCGEAPTGRRKQAALVAHLRERLRRRQRRGAAQRVARQAAGQLRQAAAVPQLAQQRLQLGNGPAALQAGADVLGRMVAAGKEGTGRPRSAVCKPHCRRAPCARLPPALAATPPLQAQALLPPVTQRTLAARNCIPLAATSARHQGSPAAARAWGSSGRHAQTVQCEGIAGQPGAAALQSVGHWAPRAAPAGQGTHQSSARSRATAASSWLPQSHTPPRHGLPCTLGWRCRWASKAGGQGCA